MKNQMKQESYEPFVSIVIRTKNRLESLKKCIKSISNQNYKNYEVIIINDNSTDNTINFLNNYSDDNISKRNSSKINIKIIDVKNRKSTAELYNIGVKNSNNSKNEIIAFIDDDCIADKKWLKELVKPFIKDKEIMVTGGKSFIGKTKKIYAEGHISGCNMAFKRKVFDRFSFDSNLIYSHLYDEVDLINRIKNKGIKIYINDKAIIYHFTKPVLHRKTIVLGGLLNCIYANSKKVSLLKYYSLPFLYCLYRNQWSSGKHTLESGFKDLISLLFHNNLYTRLPWIIYLYLFEIPFNAKITDFKEEMFYENGKKS